LIGWQNNKRQPKKNLAMNHRPCILLRMMNSPAILLAMLLVTKNVVIIIRRDLRALGACEFPMPFNTGGIVETHRDSLLMWPRECHFGKKSIFLFKAFFDHFFESLLALTAMVGSPQSQGTAKGTGLKWPSLIWPQTSSNRILDGYLISILVFRFTMVIGEGTYINIYCWL